MTKHIYSLSLLLLLAPFLSLAGAMQTPPLMPTEVAPMPEQTTPSVAPAQATPIAPEQPAVQQIQPTPVPAPAAVPPTSPALPPSSPVIIPPNQAIPIGAFAPAATDTTQEDADIYLNFENATLASVVNYLGEQKKINVVPHKDLENTKVSLTTRNPLTIDRAWDVLLTLLEMNGFSLIKVGAIYRIVPNKDNSSEPLPTYSSEGGMDPEKLPDNDLVIRYVYFFKNIKVETAKNILSKMIDNADKNIIANPDLNACIIKDQCLNIKAAMRIVKELDDGGLREAIEVIQLKWANVDNVKKMFDEITGSSDGQDRIIRFSALQQKESMYFSKNTKIIPEPVNNQLILLGKQDSIDRIKEFLYKHIDVPIDDAASRLHIKELRYVRAQDIQQVLRDIIVPPKGSGSEKGVVLEGGYKIFEDVIISAEQDDSSGSSEGSNGSSRHGGGNRLIIACNRDDWKRLEDFIDKIDKPQPQVAIEVMIVDVSKAQAKQLGAQLWNLKSKPFFKNSTAEFSNLFANAKPPATTTPPSETAPVTVIPSYVEYAKASTDFATFLTLGQAESADGTIKDNIWSIIKAVLNTQNTQIVFQPYIIANNNQPSTVSLKTTMRVNGQIVPQTNGTSIKKKDEQNAEIKVTVTPYINLTGTVDLAIETNITEFDDLTITDAVKTTIRGVTTKVSMAAGEVLVLGGLTKSKLSSTVYKTPLLGDIPIIGNLFKNKTKNKEERNIYVFLRPSIIKPRFEGAPDEYSQLKLDYAKYQIMKNDMYVHDADPIQRWFFRPSTQTIKHKLSDAARGILRPIDDFSYGKLRPKSVTIQDDPYFRTSEAIEKSKTEREAEKHKQTARALPPEHPLIKNAHLRAQETT